MPVVLVAAVLACAVASLPPLTLLPGFNLHLGTAPILAASLMVGPMAALAVLGLVLPAVFGNMPWPDVLLALTGALLIGALAQRTLHPVWTWVGWLALQVAFSVAAPFLHVPGASGVDWSFELLQIEGMATLTLAWIIVLLLGRRATSLRSPGRAMPLGHFAFSWLVVFVSSLALMTSLAFLRVSHRQLLEQASADLAARAARISAVTDLLLRERRSVISTIGRGIAQGGLMQAPPEELAEALYDYLQADPASLSILVADIRGAVLASAGNRPWLPRTNIEPRTVVDRIYFKMALENGGPYVSDVFTGRGIGSDRIVAVSTPIPGTADQPVGVIMMALDLSALAGVIRREERGEMTSSILDSTSAFVVPPPSELRDAVMARGSLPVAVGLASPSADADGLLVRESVVGATGWRVVTVLPVAALGGELRQAMRQALYIVVIGLLAALWIGPIVIGRLLIPLRFAVARLQQPIGRKVGISIADQRLVPPEVRLLLQNLLRARVHQRIAYNALSRLRQGLDDKVAERTRELEQSRAELRASADSWQMLLELSPDAVLTVDGHGAIVFANKAAGRLTGWEPGELLHRPLEILVPERMRASFMLEFGRYFAGGKIPSALRSERPILRSDGAEVPVELSVAVAQGQGGTRLIVYLRDQSLQKLAEATLLQAKTEAEAANASKTTFLAMVSHEMRTPLNTILGATELMGSAADEAEREACRSTVFASAESLHKLVNDLLDLSSMEAGKFVIHRGPVPLRETLARVVEEFRSTAAAKGLTLDLAVGEDVPRVMDTDGARFAQILINLVGNAIKFTRAGGVRIDARRDAGPGSLSWLVVEVIDSGIGIAAEARRRIFDPFVQSDGSISRAFGGTGLGLAISKRLATLLEGRIELESEPGVGSTFRIRLPIPEAAFAGGAGSAAPAMGATGVHRALRPDALCSQRPARILLVDDIESNRRVARRSLELMGHAVTECSSGQEALDLWERGGIDVVLMDVSMPGMDGLEATRRLRSRERERALGRVWIVGVTAHASEDYVEACQAAGMDEHLAKPYRRQQLFDLLEGRPDG